MKPICGEKEKKWRYTFLLHATITEMPIYRGFQVKNDVAE
jgi:hypothetical protein